MEKVEKDGDVAVLVSVGYGAGWSTWADEEDVQEAMCMDARIVSQFMAGGHEAAVVAAKALFPDVYVGGAKGLYVEWVEKGAVFRIEEHDGFESLHVVGSPGYHKA